MNEALEPGITDIKWEDDTVIDEFVDKVKGLVKNVNDIVDTMKEKLESIRLKLDKDIKTILCEY